MDNRAKALTIAVAITVLDFTVGGYCWPVIWQAWGGERLTRIGLLLFAGIESFALGDIWARTSNRKERHLQEPETDTDGRKAGFTSETLEGADV